MSSNSGTMPQIAIAKAIAGDIKPWRLYAQTQNLKCFQLGWKPSPSHISNSIFLNAKDINKKDLVIAI